MIVPIYRLLYAFIPRLPLGISFRLADVMGDLLWLFNKRARANVEQNQRRVLGPGATARQLALQSRKVLRVLARNYVDEFRIPTFTEEILKQIDFRGLEHLDAALAQGRGVILSSAHYGAAYVVGESLVLKGYPLTVLAEHLQPEELFQYLLRQRARLGARIVPVDTPLVSVIRDLKKGNRIVVIVADRNVVGTGMCLPFFGEPALFPTGAVRVALRTGAPLLVACCRRLPGNRYEGIFFPPLDLPTNPADVEAAVREGMARLLAAYESFIREQPEQWVLTAPLWQDACREDEEARPQLASEGSVAA